MKFEILKKIAGWEAAARRLATQNNDSTRAVKEKFPTQAKPEKILGSHLFGIVVDGTGSGIKIPLLAAPILPP
ncbi:hypothetical protein [Desulfocicer vacuolatum]|uniref:hypothetical protein n=1 Tax=Desulfocicer vacuolatum TaxID=2298 RepID=UPI000A01CAC2|nr:hypothetical protein [Desulfocicer vacuolatum]